MEHDAVLVKLRKKTGGLVKVQDAFYARAKIGEEALLAKFRIAWTLS